MIWIDNQPELERMISSLRTAPEVAIDTEADSLHSYFDKVCLVQLSVPGQDYVVDPLAKIDYGPAALVWSIGVLCLVGIIYGALVAWIQQDIKKLVAYSSVSHLGFCV